MLQYSEKSFASLCNKSRTGLIEESVPSSQRQVVTSILHPLDLLVCPNETTGQLQLLRSSAQRQGWQDRTNSLVIRNCLCRLAVH